MITKKEGTFIKKTLGSGYAKKIIQHLELKEIQTRKGLPYSDSAIRNIVNGAWGHELIEHEIFNFVELYLGKKMEEKARREALLNERR